MQATGGAANPLGGMDNMLAQTGRRESVSASLPGLELKITFEICTPPLVVPITLLLSLAIAQTSGQAWRAVR